MPNLNLKLKDDIEPKVLLKYGFKPKYNVDSGDIDEYYLKLKIDDDKEKHFTFRYNVWSEKLWFKRLSYTAWMSGFDWGDVTTKECLELLFKLIKDDIVEMA